MPAKGLQPDISNKVQSVNILLKFDDCLRLATALQSGIMKLNRYNRKKRAGKEMGLFLSFKGSALTVGEQRLVPAGTRQRRAKADANGREIPELD